MLALYHLEQALDEVLADEVGAGASSNSVQTLSMLRRWGPDDLREANRRYTSIAARLTGSGTATSGTPALTVRHWLAKWREAERIDCCGYVGLLPRRGQKGNRKRKLPQSSLLLLD